MKKILLIIFFLVFEMSFSQIHAEVKVDSTAILFKAKLFTVSKYGIAKENDVINYIKAQEAFFIKSPYKDFLFIKIKFDQPYSQPDLSRIALFGECYYYIAYNIQSNKFYRMGGFDFVDIDDLFEDIKSSEFIAFPLIIGQEVADEIDLECMYEYHSMSKRKRMKKGYNCFEKCSEIIYSTITEY